MNLHKMTLNPKITNTPSFPNYRADEFFANTKKSVEGDAIKKSNCKKKLMRSTGKGVINCSVGHANRPSPLIFFLTHDRGVKERGVNSAPTHMHD